MKVGIAGAGAWGTALAIASVRSGNDVTLWAHEGHFVEFDGVSMPSEIKVTKEIENLAGTDVWLIVTPAAYFRETVKKSRDSYRGQPVLICTKGIEVGSCKFMSEVLKEELSECTNFGVLSGPQFAAEVAKNIPTGSTLAGTDSAVNAGQIALSNLYLVESKDVIGAEVCGVGKNAVALISGFVNTNAGGENEKAMMFTRAWNEVVDFGLVIGADMKSFLGLCGLGDLFLSATSPTSRNYSAGAAIAKGQEIVGTVEGMSALKGLVRRASELNVPMPVLTEMLNKINI